MDWPDHLDLDASLEQRHRQHHLGLVKAIEDVERYEAIIARIKPSLIVEVGTFSGKSALWFAQHAPVLTCDPNPQIDPSTDLVLAKQPHPIRLVRDRSDSDAFIAAVGEEMAAHPGPMLLSLDGDHSAGTVLTELQLFGHVAAYIVVEDTLLRWFPPGEQVYDGGPLDAVEAWLQARGDWADFGVPCDWEVDKEIERMHPTSQFPCGWLRRTDT